MTVRARTRRVQEARQLLVALGLPTEQTNTRAALTLLALINLHPDTPWVEADNPLMGVTPIMEFAARHYRKRWKPNTRETVRRRTLHQFHQAGLVVANPDEPSRPTNSPFYCYQVEDSALALIRSYSTPGWDAALTDYLQNAPTLRQRYSQTRTTTLIPLSLTAGITLRLSPGGQNPLVKKVIEQFCPRFTPGAIPLYVGDTSRKRAFIDVTGLRALGIEIAEHGKMPDVLVHFTEKNWLVIIEAVTSHGPIDPKRLHELKQLFRASTAGLVFVTAFLDAAGFRKRLREIAWETEVWVSDTPDHMIHFNGERFLGPYPE